MAHAEGILNLADGKIVCRRCTGTSRRTRLQCAAPAERHSNKCRFHGSRGSGPATDEGRKRCAAAKDRGMGESRQARKKQQQQLRLIRVLKEVWCLLNQEEIQAITAPHPMVETMFDLLNALDEYHVRG